MKKQQTTKKEQTGEIKLKQKPWNRQTPWTQTVFGSDWAQAATVKVLGGAIVKLQVKVFL